MSPPLHQRIRADLEAQIRSGAWPPGQRIPFEHEIMARYGCSRMTASKAVSALAEAGLVVRRRKAGSFVARPRTHSAVLDIPDIAAEVAARGEAYGYELLSRREHPAGDAEREMLGLERSAKVLALRCLHRAGERPFALEARLINLDAVPDARAVDFAATPPGGWLLSHVPWTEAEHRISAANLPRGDAALMGADVGQAFLVVERRTWRGADRITHVRLSFPGDAYDLVARFRPDQA